MSRAVPFISTKFAQQQQVQQEPQWVIDFTNSNFKQNFIFDQNTKNVIGIGLKQSKDFNMGRNFSESAAKTNILRGVAQLQKIDPTTVTGSVTGSTTDFYFDQSKNLYFAKCTVPLANVKLTSAQQRTQQSQVQLQPQKPTMQLDRDFEGQMSTQPPSTKQKPAQTQDSISGRAGNAFNELDREFGN